MAQSDFKPQTFRRLTTTVVSAATCATLLATSVSSVAAQPANPSDTALAQAQDKVDTGEGQLSGLAGEISSRQEEINQLELAMGGLSEAVNKALVDLHDSQATAERARQDVGSARELLNNTQSQLEVAQDQLNEISRSAYRRGASSSVSAIAGNEDTSDTLDRKTYLRMQAQEKQGVIDDLDSSRTATANVESELRVARDDANSRLQEAQQAELDARAAINSSSEQLKAKQGQHAELLREQADAQVKLDHARGHADDLSGQRDEFDRYEASEEKRRAAEEESRRAAEAQEAAEREAEEAKRQEAADAEQREAEAEQARQDAAERQQAVDDALESASQAAAELVAATQPDHTKLENPYPSSEDAASTEIAAIQGPTSTESSEGTESSESTESSDSSENTESSGGSNDSADSSDSSESTDSSNSTGESEETTTDSDADEAASDDAPLTNQDVTDEVSGTVNGSRDEMIEAVIARGKSQLGVTYAWGGGDANGPTKGIRDGGVADSYGDFNKVGFDCSGLMIYAFAAAGISLPHYTGYQYQHGTQVPSSQMQRGDMIFWGPGASQHVALYLGDGQMLEAPQSGSTVKISPVRWAGMTPNVVRLL